MGVELRKGRLYLYERKRVGGRVRTAYMGPVSALEAEHLAWRSVDARERRRAERADAAAEEARAAAVLAAGAEFDAVADRVFRAVMHLAGYRCHHRGEWRHKRGTPVSKLQDILDAYSSPKPATGLIRPVSNDPAQREVLERAAAGDESVRPAVREWLKDPVNLTWLGSVSNMATAALATQAAGANIAVQEAVLQKLDDHNRELLADVPDPVAFPVRMAATRAAHCWLAVHILEVLVCRHTVGNPRALAVERQLASAERRLAAALKSLVVLKRLHRPVLVAQLNVAKTMVVDNRTGGG